MPEVLPDGAQFLGQPIPGRPEYVITRQIDKGRNGLMFAAHSDKLARDIACKLIPSENLIGRDRTPPTWQAEITNANTVPSSRVVKIFGFGDWNVGTDSYVYLLAELVPGTSLRRHVANEQIDMAFILALVADILDFFRELQASRLTHGDFHSGNILVEDRSESLTGARYAFRYTDFGVAQLDSSATLLDDYEQFARILKDLLELLNYQDLLPQDRAMFSFMRDVFLAKSLLERDTAYSPQARDPRALHAGLEAARRSASQSGAIARRRLTTPFDYLNCEQIGEAHVLLKELYSDMMLGLPAIEEANNLVLTGPRGCGKTTVFRCLSLKHRSRTDDDALDYVKYIGVYYRCDDLYFNFPRYVAPADSRALDVPLHFLCVTLLRELLETLGTWLQRNAARSWVEGERRASDELWSVLELKRPSSPSSDTFDALIRTLERERVRAARKQRFLDGSDEKFGAYFGPEVLPRACHVLARHFQEVGARPIYFLIDDYSAPKITLPLQMSLNRIVMQRTSSCFFKLATESPASYSSSDLDGKAYVEGREFRLVNLGMDFIGATTTEKLRFVDDVFNRRLTNTDDFPVASLERLLGDDPTAENYNETARQIREKRHPLLWGRRNLAELCSGDVHFLIGLAGKMVAAAGGVAGLSTHAEAPAVPPDVQNKAIRDEAGNFLRNLRALPRGPELVSIVEAFGKVASSYLRHRDAGNETGHPPHQASRIEPYEYPDLSPAAREMYTELLRYSVFLEDSRGKSRRGNYVPRLYLRRFLLPVFGLTFSKRDSLELSVAELTELLLAPVAFENRKRLRGPEATSEGQLPFPDRGQDSGDPTA